MKFFTAIWNLGSGLFFLGFVVFLLFRTFVDAPQIEAKHLLLLEKGETTFTTSKKVIDSSRIKLKNIDTEIIKTEYTYSAQNEIYSGHTQIDDEEFLTAERAEIRYLISDPSIHEIDIQRKLQKAKSKTDSRIWLAIGFGALIISFFILRNSFRIIRETLRLKKPKEEEEEWIEY